MRRLRMTWLTGLLYACGPSPLDSSVASEPAADQDGVRARSQEDRDQAGSERASSATTSDVDRTPSAAFQAALPRVREHLSRSHKGLTIKLRPDGLQELDLRGRFRHVHVATETEDGTPRVQCVNDPEALDALLAGSGAQP